MLIHEIHKMGRQPTIRQNLIIAFLLLFFTAKFVISTDPALKSCMEQPQDVSYSSYSTAMAYFQRCLDLGKNTSREELPAGYFNKVVANMRQSFEGFLGNSGLGEEQLATITKEIRELLGAIRRIPRKKPSKNSSHHNENNRAEIPDKILNKAQSKICGNFTVETDEPENTLHLEFVNNIWPHQLGNGYLPDEQQSAAPAAGESLVNQHQLNATNSSPKHNQMKKCGSNKNTNGVEVLTLFLCIATLAICSWMAYKIYCQYQLWARVRYEASNHKTETTPLNRSESCISTKNVCDEGNNEKGTRRSFLP